MLSKLIVKGLPKPATPALLIRISIVPSLVTVSMSLSLVTSNCTGVTCSPFNASRALRLRAPAITSPAPASTNAATSARPSPRPAPVISIRLPSISMYFGNLAAALHSRELIESRADDTPHNHQFNARQRLPIDTLAECLSSQHIGILAQLNQNHQPHRQKRENRGSVLHSTRQRTLDLARKLRVQSWQ